MDFTIETGSGINVANGRPLYFAYTRHPRLVRPLDENRSLISEADARAKAERRLARWAASFARDVETFGAPR